LRGKLFVSASLEILKQSQEMLRYGLARYFVEDGTHVAADMSLEIGGQSFVLSCRPRGAARVSGAALSCLVHFFTSAWHFSPAILFVRVAFHSRPLSAPDN
jgi:hypothetical protein